MTPHRKATSTELEQAFAAHLANMEFSISLTGLLQQKGLTVRELAQAAKMDETQVNKVLRCDKGTTLEDIVKVVHAAGGLLCLEVKAAHSLSCTTTTSSNGVTVTSRGQRPEDKAYKAKCVRCQTEVAFLRKAAQMIHDPRDGTVLIVTCPVCNNSISADA